MTPSINSRNHLRAASLILAAAALLIQPVIAQQEDSALYEKGLHYTELQAPSCLRPSADQIEIVEVFAYTCIHCYHFEQDIADKGWKSALPEGIRFLQLPVVWNQDQKLLAQLFWALESSGQSSAQAHLKVFEQFHDHRHPFNTRSQIYSLLEAAGLSADRVKQQLDSFLVRSDVGRSERLTHRWQIATTPTLVVAGRYKIIPTRSNGLTRDQMLDVALWLAQKEQDAGRGSCR